MYKPEISKNHAALHDLIERWNKACDETYIVSGRDKFWMTHRAAEALAQWYETQFRKNRTFKAGRAPCSTWLSTGGTSTC